MKESRETSPSTGKRIGLCRRLCAAALLTVTIGTTASVAEAGTASSTTTVVQQQSGGGDYSALGIRW